MESSKEEIQQLIAKAKLSKAFEQLLPLLSKETLEKAKELQSSFIQLKREKRLGLIPYFEERNKFERIILDLMKLLNQIPKKQNKGQSLT